MCLTDRFLNGILSIKEQELSIEIIEKVKFCLLDYIGVTLAGSAHSHKKIDNLRQLLNEGEGNGNCFAIGDGVKDSLQNAIFFNGINSHILELDDGSRYGVTHPGGPLFSALLPVAFRYKIQWNKFLLAVLVGYETILRISTSIQPGHYNKGFHPTATCSPLGIAVGICTMLDLPYGTIKDAFSCACISAGGSLKAIENSSQLKTINAARAAELGFTSYCMARAGFIGPEDVLEGTTGFLKIMTSQYNPDILIRKPGDDLWIKKVYCKLYASCRHTHGAIEGILKLKKGHKFNIEDIKKIEIKIYKGIKGKHDIYEIFGEESAKMSIPYSSAAALVYGNANDDVFGADNIDHPVIRKLMKIITIIEDDSISSLLPDKRATETTLYFKNNTKYTQFIDYPRGEPENPVSYDELCEKFFYLVKRSGKNIDFAKDLLSLIFEKTPDLMKLKKKLM